MTEPVELREDDERDDVVDPAPETPEEELTDQEKRKRWEENGPDPVAEQDHVSPTPLRKPDSMSLEQYQTMRAMGLADEEAPEYGPGNESYLGYPVEGNQDTSRVKASLVHEPESKVTVDGNPVSKEDDEARDGERVTEPTEEKDQFGLPK